MAFMSVEDICRKIWSFESSNFNILTTGTCAHIRGIKKRQSIKISESSAIDPLKRYAFILYWESKNIKKDLIQFNGSVILHQNCKCDVI